MSSRKARDLESDTAALLARREFLVGAAVVLASPLAARGLPDGKLPEVTLRALEKSPLVYVSPLRSNGSESTCHGEVWYAWVDGAVHLVTGKTTWKARSLANGLDRARLWVGAYGQWKRGPLRNEDFRNGPHFDAHVQVVRDADLFERLMGLYRLRYPEAIGRWEPRFRTEIASGERVMLRYTPVIPEG